MEFITALEARAKSLKTAQQAYEPDLHAIAEQIQRSTSNYTMGFSYRIFEANLEKTKDKLTELGYTVLQLDPNGDPSTITIRW